MHTAHALRSNGVVGYFQVMRAVLAGACLYSPCRFMFCCSSAALSAELLLPFPVGFSPPPGAVTSAGELEAFIFLHWCVNTFISVGRRHAKSAPLFCLLLIFGSLLLALSSNCKPSGSLKGYLVKFERKLESS